VIIAARGGILEHLTIGAGATVMSLALVTKSLPAGIVVSGNPARRHREQLKRDALLSRLDGVLERVESLEIFAKSQQRKRKRKPRTTKRR